MLDEQRKPSSTPSSQEPCGPESHDPEKEVPASASGSASGSTPPAELPETLRRYPTGVTPPPDGGIFAWLQVLGSFILFMNSWGISNTFGVYQTFYQSGFLSHEAPSNISWVGSIQAFLLLIVGVSAGPLFDEGHFRSLVLSGSVLVVLGMMMTSLCTRYWQVVLAQGVVVGLGSGLLFVPSVAIVATWFDRRKALATGLAIAGSSIGGVIYPVLFNHLQPSIGFAWTTRVIAFIALGTLAVSIAFMRVREGSRPRTVRRMFDLSAFREPAYVLFSLGSLFSFMGLYIPFYYVEGYAAERGVDPTLAFYLVAILNAGSTFGRIIPNMWADRSGPFNILIPCCLAASILAYSWAAIDSLAGIIVFCILYGFFSGSFVSLPPTAVVTLTPSLSVLGARMGMSFSFGGVGILIGNPVAGALLSRYGWIGVHAFCGTTVIVATIFMLAARLVQTTKLMVKV